MKACVAGQLLSSVQRNLVFSVLYDQYVYEGECVCLHREYGLTYRYIPLELSLTFQIFKIYI